MLFSSGRELQRRRKDKSLENRQSRESQLQTSRKCKSRMGTGHALLAKQISMLHHNIVFTCLDCIILTVSAHDLIPPLPKSGVLGLAETEVGSLPTWLWEGIVMLQLQVSSTNSRCMRLQDGWAQAKCANLSSKKSFIGLLIR